VIGGTGRVALLVHRFAVTESDRSGAGRSRGSPSPMRDGLTDRGFKYIFQTLGDREQAGDRPASDHYGSCQGRDRQGTPGNRRG